ncbi:ribonuclease 3-like protein 3 [Tripterygium wilfordii]|uniref:Ribonuclease 3-like protein 3 n=1 Tax=Tripterygium wilfordii TaxID=458696 RepID=A0A7J7D536_TRIWF|nr:ribonuclease 3-like protein 3 [Tripterygium wilfordii]KAF5741421.1 ribonuclease 3-like protein 3 [Tripterygium wilfordii]
MTAMETARPEDQEGLVLQMQAVQLGEQSASRTESTWDGDSLLPNLEEVEEILDYRFQNKSLLVEAFTDSSWTDNDFSYERLEYVGDCVLNLIFTKQQFFQYPKLMPGALTRLRAANVDTEKLARVAIKHGLHRYLRHKKPLLEEQIRGFSEAILDYPLHSNGLVDVPKSLADIVESSIGAVFIDSDSLSTVWKVFKSLLEPIIDMETLKIHPVTELYEVCQKKKMKLRFVDLWKEDMKFDVFIDDQLVGIGVYQPKKEIALNRAARDALDNIDRILAEKDGSIS